MIPPKILTDSDGNVYVLKEKTWNCVTPQTVMRHLLQGGWIEDKEYSNASYHWWLRNDGTFGCIFRHYDGTGLKIYDDSGMWFLKCNMEKWHLVDQPGWTKELI